MANIVELHSMSNEKLQEMLENAHEEMFNLRFQQAGAQLNNPLRVRQVRREIAQLNSVLHNRELAIREAANQPEIARKLASKGWSASAQYMYEDAGWQVSFSEAGKSLATALVNLNKKRPTTRRQREKKGAPQRVVRHSVEG